VQATPGFEPGKRHPLQWYSPGADHGQGDRFL